MADPLTDAALVAAACERLGIRPHALGITPLDANFAARCVAAVGERGLLPKAACRLCDAVGIEGFNPMYAADVADVLQATPRQVVETCLDATEGRTP